MSMQIIRNVQKFIFDYDWEVVEIQASFFKIAWGVWLLLPFQTFRMSQGYNAFGSENAWGAGLLILGLLHFASIMSHRINIRRKLTFISFLFWFFSAVLIYNQSHTAGILPMFGVICFFMAVNFIRLGRTIEDRRRNEIVAPVEIERRNP